MAKSPKVEKSLSDKIKAKLMTFHLPLILILAIAIGIAFPAPGINVFTRVLSFIGVALSSTPFTQMCVFMIFIISGLRLDVSAVKEALKYWVVGSLSAHLNSSTLLSVVFLYCLSPPWQATLFSRFQSSLSNWKSESRLCAVPLLYWLPLPFLPIRYLFQSVNFIVV